MKRSIIALGCVLLAGPALAQSVGEKTGVNSPLGIAPTTADFVKEVAISDMFEIESSKLAQDKGNAAEKSFASMMVTDHTAANNELASLAATKGVQLPPQNPDLVTDWSKKTDDVDATYVKKMVSDHEEAVKLFEKASKSTDADIAAFAQKTLPTLQHHLAMAQDLKNQIK